MNEPAIDSESLEGLCAAALDALPRSIIVSDHDNVLFANAAAARVIGAESSAELIGMGVNEIVHPDSHAAAAQRRQLLASSRQGLHGLPTKLVRRDGSTLSAITDAHPIEFGGGAAFVFLARPADPAKRAS